MGLYNVSSINQWHKKLRSSSTLYQIIGYASAQQTPAVATYYNFIYRIVQFYTLCEELPKELHVNKTDQDVFRIHKSVARTNIDSKRKKRLAKSKMGKTVYRKNNVCDDKVKEVLKRTQAPQDFIQILNQWLLEAVVQSQEYGLLNSIHDLSLCVDGTLYPSACHRYGKKQCECSFKERCQCVRHYSDPTAGWGYSKTKNEFVFGHRLHAVVAKGDEVHDLPIQLYMNSPLMGEVPMAIEGLSRLKYSLWGKKLGSRKSIPASHFVGDLGYSYASVQQVANHYGLKTVLLLPEQLKRKESRSINIQNGIPSCKSGQVMKYHFADYRGACYRCPARVAKRSGGTFRYEIDASRCELPVMCDAESKIGPTVYVRDGSERFLKPEIERDSELFGILYKRRMAVERFFSRVKQKNKMILSRRLPILFFLLMIKAISFHVKAWDTEIWSDLI